MVFVELCLNLINNFITNTYMVQKKTTDDVDVLYTSVGMNINFFI